MFHDRDEAGRYLAQALSRRVQRDPVVLAIPRGGVVIGAVLARDLGAELDVVLARKLRAPFQPELALGAVAEDGSVHVDPDFLTWAGQHKAALEQEIRLQQDEIARRKHLLRQGRPLADLTGRSVIVTDDGIATGSTLIAALRGLAGKGPHEVIVAVPVAAPGSLEAIWPLCDEVVCLFEPPYFRAVGQFYADFRQVEDDEVVALLEQAARPRAARVNNGS